METFDLQTFYALENSLLESPTRNSREYLDQILYDDFFEIGSSGNIYQKSDVLKFLPEEAPFSYKIINFQVQQLSSNCVLVTYLIKKDKEESHRSSIWKYHAGTWKMIFHQGTKR